MFFQERDLNNLTRITQIYKHMSKLQKDIRGPRTKIQHLFKLIKDASYTYYSRRIDDSDVVKDVFWVHPNSIKFLNTFSIVLVMDNMVKTKKNRQSLFEIVGMMSTELTFTGRKYTFGSRVFFGPNLLPWSSKKQSFAAKSSIGTTLELLWLESRLPKLAMLFFLITLFCDNLSALLLSHNSMLHDIKKHIELVFHFVREGVISKS